MKQVITNRQIHYWVATGFAGVALTAIGVVDIVRVPAVMEALHHLGYPSYLSTILGVAKLLGVLAIVTPGHARLKEWAYAGFFFDLFGAAVSHAVSGDPAVNVLVPLVLLAVVMTSWTLQPAREANGAVEPVHHAPERA